MIFYIVLEYTGLNSWGSVLKVCFLAPEFLRCAIAMKSDKFGKISSFQSLPDLILASSSWLSFNQSEARWRGWGGEAHIKWFSHVTFPIQSQRRGQDGEAKKRPNLASSHPHLGLALSTNLYLSASASLSQPLHLDLSQPLLNKTPYGSPLGLCLSASVSWPLPISLSALPLSHCLSTPASQPLPLSLFEASASQPLPLSWCLSASSLSFCLLVERVRPRRVRESKGDAKRVRPRKGRQEVICHVIKAFAWPHPLSLICV